MGVVLKLAQKESKGKRYKQHDSDKPKNSRCEAQNFSNLALLHCLVPAGPDNPGRGVYSNNTTFLRWLPNVFSCLIVRLPQPHLMNPLIS